MPYCFSFANEIVTKAVCIFKMVEGNTKDAIIAGANMGRETDFLFSLHDNYQDYYTEALSYDDRFIIKHEDGSIIHGGVWDGGHCRLICSSQALKLAERNLDLIQGSCDINSYYIDTTTSAGLYECYDK